jgi:hypothetical protein
VADTLTAACSLDLEWNGYWGDQPSGIACGEPSDATVTLACIHEHIDEARICWGCASDMQKAAGTITCKSCWNGPERHACHMLVVIGWDSGEKTTVQEAPRG